MSADTTLFVSSNDFTTLEAVARRVFELLQVELWEERFSSNYPPDGHYFAGYAENIELAVSDADSDVMAEYPFHLHIDEASSRKGPSKINPDPKGIAQALVKGGFTVFIPAGAWYKVGWDGKGDIYAA
jgi:hypothetical protein